jgi:hypothetical protein
MASSRSSGVLSADTLIATGRSRINALTVFSDGTNVATVELYDNTAGSGTVVAKGICAAATRTQHIIFENPVIVESGIYADVTGTGAGFVVFYGG